MDSHSERQRVVLEDTATGDAEEAELFYPSKLDSNLIAQIKAEHNAEQEA